MERSKTELIILGTGNATATRCYNTCFIIKTEKSMLLVDAGGGNGILNQLKQTGTTLDDIHEMFVTHAHTDHVLGAVWIIRMIIHRILDEHYKGILRIHSHDKVLQLLNWVCHMTLPAKYIPFLEKSILFCEVKDKDVFQVGDIRLQSFDILSTKEKQYGFRAELPNGQSLVCLGDEPYNEQNRPYVENADWLLCEAFCLYKDREVFKPYEKHHSTALEAGMLAEELHIKNLLLYHTEDRTLDTRKKEYTEEAALNFSGSVFVPDDLEKILME